MKKILLDFYVTKTREQVQDYMALMLEFPDYYGYIVFLESTTVTS